MSSVVSVRWARLRRVSDKIVMWRFLRNRRLILRLHRPTIFSALIYWAHRAVILAIAWFSC